MSTATFAPKITIGSLEVTNYPFGVEHGFDLDSPNTAYEVASSFVLDGSIVTSPGAGNRETVQIPVIIDWPDSGVAVRRAEALELELAKEFNTVTFEAGDGKSPATVLEIFAGNISHDYDQNLEQMGMRRYMLTFPALPFARAKDLVSFTWTGPGRELSPLTSLTGWTTSPTATAVTEPVLGGPALEMAANTTLSFTAVADNYLWIQLSKSSGAAISTTLHDITVDGAAIDPATVRFENPGGQFFYTIPTDRWLGQSVTVSFQVVASGGSKTYLKEYWAVGYPNKGAKTSGGISRPKGIDVIDVLGSARTPCTIRFTAPAGGAWVYTAPDPNAALRLRGVGETLFGTFQVTDAAGAETSVAGYKQYFPPGFHYVTIGMTDPQPIELNPNGVFPSTEMTTFTATGITGTFQFPTPIDKRAAVSYYTTSGAKALISRTPSLPQGYRGDAIVFTPHALHAGRCGFAVLDNDGDPITATVDYYPRNWIHAAH